MYACDYLENGVLNVLRGVTFAAPAKVYLALYLNDPGEDGASGTEVSYAGYKRIEIDFSSPAETNGGIGVQNLEDITFPTPVTAAGTITHVGILDSLAGGNMLCRGELGGTPRNRRRRASRVPCRRRPFLSHGKPLESVEN